jgi:DNA-binding transcriptional LysR family regulator
MPASLVRQHINRGLLLPVLAAHCRTPVDVHVMWLRKATLSPRCAMWWTSSLPGVRPASWIDQAPQ